MLYLSAGSWERRAGAMNNGDPTASLDIVQEGLVEVKEKSV